MDLLMNFIVGILSHCICILSHPIVGFKYIKCYLSIKPRKEKEIIVYIQYKSKFNAVMWVVWNHPA